MAQKLYALFWQFFSVAPAHRAPFTTLASLLFPHPAPYPSRSPFSERPFRFPEDSFVPRAPLTGPSAGRSLTRTAGAMNEVRPEWRRVFELTLASFASQHLKIVAAVRPKS